MKMQSPRHGGADSECCVQHRSPEQSVERPSVLSVFSLSLDTLSVFKVPSCLPVASNSPPYTVNLVPYFQNPI